MLLPPHLLLQPPLLFLQRCSEPCVLSLLRSW